MSGFLKLLIAAALGLALYGTPVAAQDIHIEPIPPHVRPQWTPVPNVAGVYYAPNIPTDVFRRGTKYYFYWEGYLYRGNKPRGPWKAVTKVPAWFPEIDPSLFKTAGKGPGAPAAGAPAPAPPGPGTPPAAGPAPPEAGASETPPPAPERPGETPPVPAAPGQSPKVM